MDTSVLQRPVTIAAIVAVVSIVILLVVNHTNVVVDHRPPTTPPGTTFNAVKDAGAEMAPTQPDAQSKIPGAESSPAK